MGWKGIAVGGWIGSVLGGPLGAVIGAALGHGVEKTVKTGLLRTPCRDRAAVFCASAAAMLAKMAKADGRISQTEIAAVEVAFCRLGFSDEARAFAVSVFRKAKDDSHSIYEYARDFAQAVPNHEVRTLFYELLWDLACADGVVTRGEDRMLREIISHLGINASWYAIFARERLGAGGESRQSAPPSQANALADAYSALGVSPSASDEDVRRAYRDMAKKYHPDTLRAQGLPEEMVGRATERMSKINAAWSEVRKARGL